MRKINFSEKTKRRFRYGTNSIILMAVVIAVAVLVNVLLEQLPMSADLTKESLYSITDTTKKVLSELDRDVLGQYFLARERWLRADKLASQAIRDKDETLAQKWASTQNTYFRQARQCAESMGLSVTARCRIVVPAAIQNAGKAGPEDGADEFTRTLRARQAAALEAAE